jgi:FKBP-type peptidyl-prolyl cis-trans isomerase
MITIQEIHTGEGPLAKTGDTVSIHYRGSFPEGGEFDSSYRRDAPFSFRLGGGQVIRGFDLGVTGMAVGGKRKITIPPELGYGARGAGGVIPPNATLVFEVELLDIR